MQMLMLGLVILSIKGKQELGAPCSNRNSLKMQVSHANSS